MSGAADRAGAPGGTRLDPHSGPWSSFVGGGWAIDIQPQPGLTKVRASPTRSGYFATVALIVLGLTLLGFSDNLLTNVGQPSNSDPKFIIHGLFCLGWMVLFVVQTQLVRLGHVRWHRTLGLAGTIVAAGVVLSTLWVFIAVWKGWAEMPVWARANRLLLPSFGVLVLAALLRRRRPDWHRRLMLMATLYMLEPVLSRAFDPFPGVLDRFTEPQVDAAWWAFFVVTWNGLFASLFIHDRLCLGRIHPVTIGGYFWFCLVWVVVWVT